MAGLLKMAAAHEKQNVIVQRLQAKSVKQQSLEDACKKQEAVIEKLERLTTSGVEKSGIYTTKGEMSSICEEFLAVQSQFDTDHGADFYAPTSCLSATFVRPLFAFVLCFLRQKSINNLAFRHRCDF